MIGGWLEREALVVVKAYPVTVHRYVRRAERAEGRRDESWVCRSRSSLRPSLTSSEPLGSRQRGGGRLPAA
jgi:hypothetical protein